MPAGFHTEDYQVIAGGKKISFIRIKIDDYKLTLANLLASMSSRAWINRFAEDYLRIGFEERVKGTLDALSDDFHNIQSAGLKKDTGEKIVSETARLTLVNVYKYSDIPLAELFKQQVDGNPGFDFYAENQTMLYVLFGEAKYKSDDNAFGVALKQIEEFRDGVKKNGKTEPSKLLVDLPALSHFCSQQSLNRAANKECGFVAAFKCTDMRTDMLIRHIQNNAHYNNLINSEELILIAVEI